MKEYPFRPTGHHHRPEKHVQMLRYLLLGWCPDAIAEECCVSISTVYKMQSNLMRYGSITKLHLRLLGRSRKLTEADKQALFTLLVMEGWRYQDKLVWWLWNECGVLVDRSTVSRLIKRN